MTLPFGSAGFLTATIMAGEKEGMMKILLVDHDKIFLQTLKENLEQTLDADSRTKGKTEILVAYNGKDGQKMFGEHHPDVVISAIMLPVCNGWEMMRNIRAMEAGNGGTRCLAVTITAIGPNLNEITSPLYGFDDFVDKPICGTEVTWLAEKIRVKMFQ
ncbi:hypothetical protein A2223_02955 [Candidatus Falkowbacteria bacterium RIFOXYA2_FULL_35_8]|nr:MAG: hypothetical protein A2223_02955 [Candidatus Falkowbacteria bacterium RIFOXYA2_FULL_35_8]